MHKLLNYYEMNTSVNFSVSNFPHMSMVHRLDKPHGMLEKHEELL